MANLDWLDAIIAEQRRIQLSWGITPEMLDEACEYLETHNEMDEEL